MKGATPYTPPTADDLEARRPGIKAIIAELKKTSPRRREEYIHADAKAEWHRRNGLTPGTTRGFVMLPIPVEFAQHVAGAYGYDQVIVIGRRVDDATGPGGEHVTTYGVGEANSTAAASTGGFLKHKIMGWPRDEVPNPAGAAIAYALELDDDDDTVQFLRMWSGGDFEGIRREYEAIPEAVFIGAEVGYVASK